ncbi:MAG TPA: cyclic nucleotide-binding domain-containing protein [Thermoanaerobaculia bacterium]|nr:cyclic nucleotide-binding domain-containing protein [Thermoanaerobaculia bacterium]
MFKKLFGGSTPERESAGLTLEDLIILERYDEAEAQLKAKLKATPGDRHARLKLAEVYIASKQAGKAVDEYVVVATEYSQDGFYDKALALLTKAQRVNPMDETMKLRIEALERAKRLEHSRVAAVEGLRAGAGGDLERQSAALEIQQLWRELAGASLVARLGTDQLKRLFAVMKAVRVEPGTVLAQAGSTLAQMALVGRGVVEAVLPKGDGGWAVLRTFSAGDLIGEGALLEHQPWPATYRVAESAYLLTLDRQGLEQALQGNPDPRGLLVALREQHLDREVAVVARHLGA